MKPKYTNYKQLAKAFKTKELDPKRYYIMMDKGGSECCLCYRGTDDETMDEIEQKNMDCDEIFQLEYDGEHIEALFDALGIPSEWC